MNENVAIVKVWTNNSVQDIIGRKTNVLTQQNASLQQDLENAFAGINQLQHSIIGKDKLSLRVYNTWW